MAQVKMSRIKRWRKMYGGRIANVLERFWERRIINPSPPYKTSYPYGVRSSRYAYGYHTGEDHACPSGTPLIAVSFGKVVSASYGPWGQAYGYQVVIETRRNGPYNRPYRYAYCHMSRINVRAGQSVKPGDVIGHSGSSGNVTGPHLHFEARHYPYSYGDDVHPIRVKRRSK